MNFGLVLLLWLLNYSSAQDANCDYYQSIGATGNVYLTSPNYPNSYARGVTCRWVVDCPPGYNCRLDCSEIRLPQTPSCNGDRMLVSRSGDQQLNGAEYYCGSGSLSGVLSTNQRLSIGLISAADSAGGRFQCTVRSQAISTTPPPACRCGERRQNRIVGGQETGVNEFTMMAGLVDYRITTIKCGAVIISAWHTLTAAHCVDGQSVNNYAIVVGEHNVNTGDSPATKAYRITRFITHPSYTASTYDNDIAVVVSAAQIEFNDFVQPVCLPFKFSTDFAGVKATAVGWGTLYFGGPSSNVPMKVDLDVLPQSTCRSRGAAVTDRQMCTWTSGKDTCQDDSGGPLLWTNPSNGALYNIGIISFGRYCATTTPGLNTRVTSFLSWILSVTGTTQQNYCVK